jgi:hypothetical protein
MTSRIFAAIVQDEVETRRGYDRQFQEQLKPRVLTL